MSKDILMAIQSEMHSFSKGQKAIAHYILESYDKAAFMTANKLGKTVNVSESTVVRFSTRLGFDGYPSMQKALQEMIRNKLTSVQRIEVSKDRMASQDILSMVMQSDMDKIRITLEEIDRESFDEAVRVIGSAKRIFVLGVRSASAIATFICFYFTLVFNNVIPVHLNSASEMFEHLLHVDSDDVVIGISFPRYSHRTIQAMKYAKDRGANVVAITDSMASPLVGTANITLTAKSDMASFVDSLVAPLSLVNALIVALGSQKSDELENTFGALEKIWAEYNVYEQMDT